METTKGFFKNYWKFAGWAITAWLTLFAFAGDKLINYYCGGVNSFFWSSLYKYTEACSVYVSFGYIFAVASAVLIAGLLISIPIDVIRIKTEKIFQLDANKPISRQQNVPRWASITITNISGEILRNCFVDLVDILDKNGKSVLKIKRQRKLKWSAGDPPRNEDKSFQPDEQHVIDVAYTDINSQQFILDTQNGEEPKGSGEYEVIIAVRAELDGKPKSKRRIFTLTYYKKNIITIRKKGDVEWTEIDPQPPKIKGKYPSISIEASS